MSDNDRTFIAGQAMDPTMMASNAGRTQMGGTFECPVCRAMASTLDVFCPDCGFRFGGVPVFESSTPDDIPAYIIERETHQKYALHDGVNTVGRINSDVTINDPTVSRNHAKVTVQGGLIFVEDLGSSNGTKVDNDRVLAGSVTPVRHGAKLRFGTWRAVLQITSAGEVSVDEPEAPPAPPAPEKKERTIQAVKRQMPPAYEEVAQQNFALSGLYDYSAIGGDILQKSEEAPEASVSASAPPLVPLGEVFTPSKELPEHMPGSTGSLFCVDGDAPNIPVMEGSLSIGRKVGNDIVLPNDSYVSGRHAVVRNDDTGSYLIDVGSTNGTVVNGTRMEANVPVLLCDGDEVQLGKNRFIFRLALEEA